MSKPGMLGSNEVLLSESGMSESVLESKGNNDVRVFVRVCV